MIYTLKNPIKNFLWGSRTAIRDHFGIGNPNSERQAELWMGAHSSSSSFISQDGVDVSLYDMISSNPEYWLGKNVKQYSSSLPFLMKILAVEQPLSIQVHPSKEVATLGFSEENRRGIPLDASNRNYKDENHKPELVYAITPYKAMNGFRELHQIISNFDTLALPVLKEYFQPFKQDPSSSTLATFFRGLLGLEGSQKEQAIDELIISVNMLKEEHFLYQASMLINDLYEIYPEDIGLFTPLLLNVVELQPGEAMFLHAETPHAYLYGLAIEVMASSDNVLRAGLTPKHIDVEELVKNTKFEPIAFESLVLNPSYEGIDRKVYSVPVDDFRFEVVSPKDIITFDIFSPEVLLCLSESVTIVGGIESRVLYKGESVIIPGSYERYHISGSGSIARVSC